eukprot:scaffold200624_cov18-Tisochrysis_lutea.AAC.1
MKGGKLSKAVDMCFAAQLFDVLGQIADDLSAGGDPVLYMRCAGCESRVLVCAHVCKAEGEDHFSTGIEKRVFLQHKCICGGGMV